MFNRHPFRPQPFTFTRMTVMCLSLFVVALVMANAVMRHGYAIQTCTYTIAPASQVFSAGGGSGSVTVTTGSACAWTASSNAAWITISSGGSGSGNGAVNFSVAANTDSNSRGGTLTIAGRTFTVAQAGTGGSCTNTPIIPAQTVNGALIASDCRAVSRSGATFADRYAFTAVAGQQVNIFLGSSAFDAFLGLLDSNGTVVTTNDDSEGRNSRIVATLANPGTYIIEATALNAGSTGDYALTYNATIPNCNFSIAPASQTFPGAGGTGTVNVAALGGCSWAAVSNASWLTITGGNSGAGNGTVSFSVAVNTSSSRTGTLAIAGQVFTVTQSACLSISPASQAFGPSGGAGSVTVTGLSACIWTATSAVPWLMITSGASGSGNGTVNFSVAANTDSNGRGGALTIAGRTFTVVQAGAGGSCPVTPIIPAQTINGALGANDCRAVSRDGQTLADRYSFTGVIGQQIEISLNSSAFDAFLGLLDSSGVVIATDDDSGDGVNSRIALMLPATGTYTIEAAARNAGNSGDYALTYNATIPNCNFVIAPTNQMFSGTGGTGTVNVAATAGCNWAAVSNASWLTITSGGSGAGNGSVGFSVAPNSASTPRTGTLAVAGRVFTVTQSACLSIAPTNQAFGPGGGTSSVTVSGLGICNWTAISNVPWLTITSGGSGAGVGTVNFSIAPNPDGNSRSGTMTIAGNTFTAVQAGAGGSCTPSPIIPAQTINGTLAANDCRAVSRGGESLADRYSFTGVTGQQVVFALDSSSFNAFLGLLDANGAIIATDDDGGGGNNARIMFTLPANGTYIIEAAARNAGGIGDYALTYNTATIPNCNFTIAPASQTIPGNGGTGTVNVTAPGGCSWAAVSNASWLTVTAGNSGAGNGVVSFSVTLNNTDSSRTGTLAIAGQLFTVTQPTCLSIAPANQAFNPGGGTGSVTVTGLSGCSWTATSAVPWLTVTSGSSGAGNGTVNYTVAANNESSARSTVLTITGHTFTVVQAGPGGTCTPQPILPAQIINGTLRTNDCPAVSRSGSPLADRYSLTGVAGQQVDISLNSSIFDAFLGLLGPNNAVLATDDNGGGGNNARIMFTLPANGTYIIEAVTRNAGGTGDYVLGYNATIPNCNFTIAPASQTFPGNGGTGTVNVTATAGCNWASASNASWLTITAGNSGAGNGTVNFSVAANDTGSSRTGSLAIAGRAFTVTQPACLSIAPANQAFNAGGGTGSVTVTGLSGCNWTATGGAPWLMITSGGSGNGNGTVNYTAAPNTDSNGRAGTLTIANRTFTVVQAGAGGGCTPLPIIPVQTINGTLSTNDCRAISRDGQTLADRYSFTGVAGQQIEFSLASSAFDAFLGLLDPNGALMTTDDNGGGGSNARIALTLSASGTYIIEAAARNAGNTGDYSLNYNATIPNCNFGITPTGQTFPGVGGTGTVNLTGPSGCSWAAASNASWLSITSGNSGGGNGAVNYTVAANGSTNSRTGTLAIAGRVFTVTQAACLSISPANQAFDPGGGTGSVAVTGVSGCSWTASSGAPWLMITAGGSGAGNGMVSYAAAANTDSNSRAGTLTVAGGTFTVVQAGAGGNCTPLPVVPAQTVNGALMANDCRAVSRSSVSFADRYSFIGVTGQQVDIFLNSSAFDAYLGLIDPNGAVIATDDDGGGGRNSRITRTLPASGVYIIEATSLNGGNTGDYTLRYNATKPAPCNNYSISPASLGFQSSGGTGSVNVTAPAGCTWETASNDNWLTITTAANGNGNGTVNYTVAPNPNNTVRAGTLAIAGRTFTVNQAAGTSYEADVTPRPTGDSDGTVTVADAIMVGRFVSGLETAAPGSEFQRADCAPKASLGDGRLTVSDWIQANRYAAGLDPIVVAGGPSAQVAGLRIANCGLRSDGASSSCNPALFAANPQSAIRNPQSRMMRATVEIPSLRAERKVTLELGAQGDEHAMGFSLSFDPAQWRFVSAQAGRDALTAKLLVNAREVAQGRIGWALALPAGQTLDAGTRQLVVLTLEAAGGAHRSPLALSFGDDPVAREIVNAETQPLAAEYTVAGDVHTVAGLSDAGFNDKTPARKQMVAALGSRTQANDQIAPGPGEPRPGQSLIYATASIDLKTCTAQLKPLFIEAGASFGGASEAVYVTELGRRVKVE